MCYKYFHNTTRLLLQSGLFMILMSSFALSGCQKELLETPKIDPRATYFKVQPKHPISIADAQTWFTAQFGKFKQVSFNPFRVSGTDAYYFHETFTIEPIWEFARQSTYRNQDPITIVPVQPIDFLDAKEQKYALIFYRDSFNQLQSQLQVYIAVDSYKKVHPQEKVKDFSGMMYQVDYEGRVHHVFAAKEGRFLKEFSLGENRTSGQNTITVRSHCFGLGPSIWEELWCVLLHVFDGPGGGSSGNSEPSGGSTFINLGFGSNFPYTGGNSGNGSVDGGGGGGGGSASSGSNNNIDSQIDDTLFDMGNSHEKLRYYQGLYVMQMGFTDTEFEQMYNDRRLFTQIEHFLRQRGRGQEAIAFCKEYQELYFTDSEFREMVSTPIPPFVQGILVDVGLEVVERVIRKFFPGVQLAQESINAVQAIRAEDWPGLVEALKNIAKVSATRLNPTLATALAVKDVGSLLSKFYKMREPFADMYAHLNDAPVFKRIYENISAATGRDVIGRFSLFKYPSGTDKHFGFDQKINTAQELSLRTVFDAIATQYPNSVVHRETNGNGFYFDVHDIRFTWYPVAATNRKPTIEITKNGYVITKIRTL